VTAVLNIGIPVLAGATILAALLFVWRGIKARSHLARHAYGVGRQEARQAMQVDFVRAVAAFFVSLILLGVFGLSPRPAEILPTPTPPSSTILTPTATALPTVTATRQVVPTLEPSPTGPSVTETPTAMPTATATAAPQTATVSSGVGVWLRAAATTEAEQLEWLLDGTVLTLLPGRQSAEGFEWQQVRTPAGNEGWVAVDFIVYDQ
jgi:hypothetical protein